MCMMTYISYKWVYYESPTGKGYVDFSPKNKSYVKNDTFLHFAVYIFCGLVTRVLCINSLVESSGFPGLSGHPTSGYFRAGGTDWTRYKLKF